MSTRYQHHKDGSQKSVTELLGDLIWQGAVQVYFLKVIAEQGAISMANIEEVQAAIGKIEGDVGNVQRVLGELNTTNAALVQQVADLQAQIAAGNAVTPEQLQELADRLAAADAALDTLAPDAPDAPNEPTE